MENALDAGAGEVRVEVRGGGLRLIRVTDDGYGIPEDELERACARHSTSKINSVEDLDHLHTLGFRGEALASIAAVSELTLLSRAIETEAMGKEHAAVFITLRGGEVTQRGRKARLHGTTITVRDLFYNVPARLKFMRGARTEGGHPRRDLSPSVGAVPRRGRAVHVDAQRRVPGRVGRGGDLSRGGSEAGVHCNRVWPGPGGSRDLRVPCRIRQVGSRNRSRPTGV